MKNKKIIILRIIIIILILFWMRLVFGLSAQNSEASTELSFKAVTIFTKNLDKQAVIEPYIRKLAHYSEYGVGGMLFFSLFSTYNLKERNRIIYASLMGIAYARNR